MLPRPYPFVGLLFFLCSSPPRERQCSGLFNPLGFAALFHFFPRKSSLLFPVGNTVVHALISSNTFVAPPKLSTNFLYSAEDDPEWCSLPPFLFFLLEIASIYAQGLDSLLSFQWSLLPLPGHFPSPLCRPDRRFGRFCLVQIFPVLAFSV